MLGGQRWSYRLLLSFALCISGLANPETEQFYEQLTFKSFRDGKVLSAFSFKMIQHGVPPRNPDMLESDDVSQHYTLFPLALGQILREYAVSELHLTLNAGNWRYDRWGYPEELGVGTGAELWAWMGDGSSGSVDERWKGLRNALSGLFCASLGSLDEQRTTSPLRTFHPEGRLPNWGKPHQLRHASLPSENVCTENLTPFVKLLPCKSLSGIASLLNPHRLFDADWHGMGVHVLWHKDTGIEVRLAFQAVFDPVRISDGVRQDWSLQNLFDRTIDRDCPVAKSSHVMVVLPSSKAWNVTPEPSTSDNDRAIFEVHRFEKPLNVALKWGTAFQYPPDFDSPIIPLSVNRRLTGSNQGQGKLLVFMRNHLTTPLNVDYLETMPWHVQFYLHTLNIRINGIQDDNAISNLSYVPAQPRVRPTTFQSTLTLPPQSKLELTMDVAKAFLRYTEHPPDAQRGWDLPPAVFSLYDPEDGRNSNNPSDRRRIYSSILLVDLATPDFSMPYNVIIFTCSLISFIFGTVFNLLTRKFVVVKIIL